MPILVFAAAAIAAIVVMTLAGAFASRAKITGSTPAERVDCITRLADEQPWGAADVLARGAAEESDSGVRRAALVGLGRFASAEHRGVVEVCTKDAEPLVRAGAAIALGRYEDEAAADRLLQMAGGDADREVRLAAVVAVSPLPGAKVTDGLIEVMAKDRDIAVRRRAMDALCKRFGFRYWSPPDPRNPEAWRQAVATMRQLSASMAAGKSASSKRREK